MLVLLHVLQLMCPERDIVECIFRVAKDDDVYQGDGIDIGILQQGVGSVQLRFITDLVASRVEHLNVVVGFELGPDVQRDG
ncbi:hypothetical protein D3C72_2136930 [compost metagenome]